MYVNSENMYSIYIHGLCVWFPKTNKHLYYYVPIICSVGIINPLRGVGYVNTKY